MQNAMYKNMNAIIVIFMLLVCFFMFGSLITCRTKGKNVPLFFTINIGFLMYFAVFEIMAFPMKILLQPLSRLSIAWVLIVLIMCCISLILNRRVWFSHTNWKYFKYNLWMIIAVALVISGMTYLVTNNIHYGSTIDSAYYIGASGSSVLTDSIEQYDPYTGVKRDALDPLYILLTYSVHNSVISQITKIHPLIVYRLIMSSVTVIISSLALYNIAAEFLKKRKMMILSVWLIMLAVYMCGYSMYSPSGFLFYRAFEGKTILAVIVIPTLLLMLIRTIKYEFRKWDFVGIVGTLIGGMAFSMSAMLLMPALISMYYVPILLKKKELKILWQYAVFMAICVGFIGIYMCFSKGIWQVEIP